jgi:hypothetical protein
MRDLTNVLHAGLGTASACGLLYAITVAVAASAAVFAQEPTRRQDARAVLAILLGRRPSR